VSESAQDYLEQIHTLIQGGGRARVTDIALSLGLSRPSVSAMIRGLARQGYVTFENYGAIAMTPRGQRIAEEMRRRHVVLTDFLVRLGVDRKTADADAEGMEHHVSPKTLRCIERWLGA
jgi:DtxR family manganese transport transcriptional regulator